MKCKSLFAEITSNVYYCTFAKAKYIEAILFTIAQTLSAYADNLTEACTFDKIAYINFVTALRNYKDRWFKQGSLKEM